MPTKAFARGSELKQKIKNAKDNEVITLPLASNDFGEYQGPLILDKPVTLVGKGDKTPLFGKGCPAIVILSSGVKLKDIEVADSFDTSNGVALLVRDGSNPTLENVRINGQTMTMSQEQVIDLGDFLPQQRASSYFEIEVSGPSRVKCSESSEKWLRVSTDSLAEAGRHLLQFTCDGGKLGADAFAVGSVEVSTGSSVTIFWVMVHVLPAPPAKILSAPIALILGKDHRIRFTEGFMIGKNRFPGVSAAASIAERQAIILKDAENGAWTIYQPWKTPTPTLVNGQVLNQGHRICLQEGYVLRMGGFELKVEEFKGSGAFSVNKAALDLGAAGSTSSDNGFKIQYTGKGKGKARITAIVPWLEVRPDVLDFQKGDVKDVSVAVTPAAASLPTQKHRERSAILVQSKEETLSLDVNIDVKRESIIPRASLNFVKFEKILDWNKTQTTVMLYNDGTREWKPAARLDCDWMDVEPANISVPAGKGTAITLRFNQKVEKLPSPGQQQASLSLEGDGASLKIKISAELQIVRSEPSLETPLLDFKELGDVTQSLPATLIIRNKGKKDWQAKIVSKVAWLDILSDPAFVLPGNGQKTIPVHLNGNLPVGEFSITDAILVEGEGKSLSAAVKVKLASPASSIEIFPRLIDFGKVDDLKTAPEPKVAFRNRGNAEWSGTVRSSVGWLEVSVPSGVLKCNSKSEETISFRITGQIPEGQHNIADAVIFEGSGGPYTLPLRVEHTPIINPRSMPIDFGEVMGWASAPAVTIPVYNDGNKDWDNVQVSVNVPWITVSPDTLKIQKSGKADIHVRLNEKVNQLSPGENRQVDAIVLSGSGIILPIEVKLALPQIELQASEKEITFFVEYENAIPTYEQRIVIANIGRRDWSGKIESRVPWLKVEPENTTIGVKGRLNLIISTTDELCTLNTGEQLFGSLIAFENSSLTLDVRVNLKKIVPIPEFLDFEPNPLDFGRVEPGSLLNKNHQVSIYSELDWQADIQAQDGWFTPVVGQLSGSAGKKSNLSVEVNDGASKLHDGVHWSELVFTIKNGKRFALPVKVEKVEPPPVVIVHPAELNYFLNVNSKNAQSQKLIIENKSKQDWDIWLEPSSDWLEVSPISRVTCPANDKVDFLVFCSSRADTLKDGKYTQELFVRVGPKHRIPCQVALNLDRSVAEWSIMPEGVISLGKVEKRAESWKNHQGTEFTIQNNSERTIDFQIFHTKQGVSWLDAPSILKIPGKSSKKVAVSLKQDDNIWSYLKLGNQEDTLQVVGAGKSSDVKIILTVKPGPIDPIEKKLPLIIDKQKLSFAERDKTKWSNEPPQIFTIENPNTVTRSIQIKAPTWLTVSPSLVDIKPSSRVSVEIKLNEVRSKSSPFGAQRSKDLMEAEGTIGISCGNEIYSINVDFGGQNQVAPVFLTTLSGNGTTDAPLLVFFSVAPLSLDFGTLTEWNPSISQIIKIKNLGNIDLKVNLQSAKWFDVIDELVIPATQTSDVKVSLKQLKIFERPKGKNISDHNGIVISTPGQSISIRVDMKIK